MENKWIELKHALSSECSIERNEALVKIKNTIIGSNSQKSLLISHQIVPDIIKICSEDNHINQTEALIILGSLVKGSSHHTQILVEQYKIIPILKRELIDKSNQQHCIEICLRALSSITEHTRIIPEEFFDDAISISFLLELTTTLGSSLKSQIYVMTILYSLCQSKTDQINYLNAGAIPVLARLISIENEHLQIPALTCLSCMCFANRSVSDIICVTSYQGKSLTDMLNCFMSRIYSPNIQLIAARCVTYIYRSGTLPSSDFRILHRALPCLVRLCSDDYKQPVRASAAETLAILIEVDAHLQQIASICNHLLKSLHQLTEINDPNIKQAAFNCLAFLGSNDETVRRQIINLNNLIDNILQNLNDWKLQVRIASIRCLHSLSRSVQQLRTTFQDYSIWEPLVFIMNNETSTDILIVATATICNLLLEFSPTKAPLIKSGIYEKLSDLIEHENTSLRLNSIWALMNLTYQSNDSVKMNVLNFIGISRLLNLLKDSNTSIVLKALGLWRNLCSQSQQVDKIMSIKSREIMSSLCVILDSCCSTIIKEQILCVIGCIAAEGRQIDYIVNNDQVLKIIGDLLFHSDRRIQSGALYVINNVVHRKDIWADKSYSNLANKNVLKNVQELNKNILYVQISNDYISQTLKQIIVKCKNMQSQISN